MSIIIRKILPISLCYTLYNIFDRNIFVQSDSDVRSKQITKVGVQKISLQAYLLNYKGSKFGLEETRWT